MSTKTDTTTHVYQVWIKATPERIWEAITSRDWSEKYGYKAPFEYDLRPGGRYQVFASAAMSEYGSPNVIVDGEVIESDPPHRLVQTWHAMFDETMSAEPATRVTWEITEASVGISKLTVVHDATDAPITARITSGQEAEAGGGWAWILSDLKTLLETGSALER
jgi:uncharacterized protein YndB with AHSA1/START domain